MAELHILSVFYLQYCSPRQFWFVNFEPILEPEGPSCASDSTTVLDRKPCHFSSHEYLFVSGHLSPNLKERLPALFHEYTLLGLYIHNCWLFGDITMKQANCCRMAK